jgi:hypothetical protein
MAWLGRIIFLVLDCFFLKPSSALENAEFLNLANNTKEQVSFLEYHQCFSLVSIASFGRVLFWECIYSY